METKSKYRVTQSNNRRAHDTPPSGNGATGQPSEDQTGDESGMADQVVEEVLGTTDTNAPIDSSAELTDAEGHRPVSSPVSSASKKRESVETSAETEPVVEASFASITALQDRQEFWGAIAGALGPLILSTVKSAGGSLIKSGIKKISPTLSGLLRREGFSETTIQQLEASQQETSTDESATIGREFWGKLSTALTTTCYGGVRKPTPYVLKDLLSKTKVRSSQQESGEEMEALSEQLEALFLEQAEATQQESSTEAAAQEREFWGLLASALAPVLAPVAKAAVQAGTSLVKSGIKKISPTLSGLLRREGFSETTIQQLEASQQEAGTMDEREFWGSIAKVLVPVFKPVAQKVAGMAIKTGTSLVKGGIKKLFESSQQESSDEMEALTEHLEALFLEQVESDQESSTEAAAQEREFWGAIASALVPVLAPVAKAVAGAAVKAGTSLVKSGIKKISPTLSGLLRREGFSETTIQQLEASQQEAGTMDEREFWGAIASALGPVLKPVAKTLVGAAVKTGTSLVKGGIKKLFESSQQESGEEMEALSEQLEALFLEQAEATQQESSTEAAAQEREFWGLLASALAPVLAPVAKAVAGAAVKAGTSLVKSGIKKISPTLSGLLRREGFSETTIQQLEASQQEVSHESVTSEQEFWGSIAKVLVPVFKPVAQKVAGVAIKTGTSLVKGGIKKLFESSQQESSDEIDAQIEALAQQFEAQEVIIEEDDRVQITNTTDLPYKRICHLSIKAGDGSSYLGTGFFIGPRTILTAGHCVYIHEHGGWPQQIIVSPGRNGANKPFGQFTATNFRSVAGWVNNQSRDHDYGVIQLAKSDRVSPEMGTFGFGMFSDQALRNKQLSTAGYPGDKPAGTMMFHSRKATDLTPRTIIYDIDTMGGQSGSAVYDEKRVVVGIHTNGASSGNSATRITQPVFNNLTKWRSEGGAA